MEREFVFFMVPSARPRPTTLCGSRHLHHLCPTKYHKKIVAKQRRNARLQWLRGPDLNGDFGLRFPKSQILTSAHFLPRFISHCERSVKKQVIRQTRRAHNPKSNYFSFCSLIQSKKRTPCGVLFALAPQVGLEPTTS